jgi:hypothetical protein
MTEQQTHLKNLIIQKEGLLKEINDTQERLARTRESCFRVQGAIDYLTQIMGVTLPEPDQEVVEDMSEPES